MPTKHPPIDWRPVMREALSIVRSYPYLITLRQLHYRLVMAPDLGYRNAKAHYSRLSDLTSKGRRDGSFDALLDQTREIYRSQTWTSPSDAIDWLNELYERDRTEGQKYAIYLAGEKATLLAQLQNWFTTNRVDAATRERLYGADDIKSIGCPIVLLRGYGSQTYKDDVTEDAVNDGRKAVLIYAGDFDPSGEDIQRDFLNRVRVWHEIRHIAVRPEQIDELSLPVAPGKTTDSRARGFVARHGELVQVEVEAIPPDTLRSLYADAINEFWDEDAYQACLEQEQADRAELRRLTGLESDD